MFKISNLSIRQRVRNVACVGGVISLIFAAASAHAGSVSTIWGDSASFGAPILQEWDLNGNLLQTIYAPNGSNGRGVVQVGDVVYYTSATTNGVYAYNFVTNTDLGTAFTIPGASGLSTIAYDGTNFFIGDYSGTNNVYKYTPTGTLLATIPMTNCAGFCDGLEFANGRLLTNRGDAEGPYDVYSTTGTLLTPAFITGKNTNETTGIAFDGTFYYISNIFDGTISVFDINGNWVRDFTLQQGPNHDTLVEDLSVNYSLVIPPSGTPLPAALPLFATGIGGLGLLGWRRKKKAAARAA